MVAVVHQGDAVVHVLERPLEGDQVRGHVDEARRRDHRQQHHGQHLLSRALLDGAGAPTTSFHLGEAVSTIDVAAELSTEAVEKRRAARQRRRLGRPAGHGAHRLARRGRRPRRARARGGRRQRPHRGGGRVRPPAVRGHPSTQHVRGRRRGRARPRAPQGRDAHPVRLRRPRGGRVPPAAGDRRRDVGVAFVRAGVPARGRAPPPRRGRGRRPPVPRAAGARARGRSGPPDRRRARPRARRSWWRRSTATRRTELRTLAGHVVAQRSAIALLGSRHEGRAHLVFARSPGRSEDVGRPPQGRARHPRRPRRRTRRSRPGRRRPRRAAGRGAGLGGRGGGPAAAGG